MPVDKRQLYEFDLRVPLIIRGPNVPKNVTRTEPVLNIDLAPTMLDIANGSTGHFPVAMDGVSFLPLLQKTVCIIIRISFPTVSFLHMLDFDLQVPQFELPVVHLGNWVGG